MHYVTIYLIDPNNIIMYNKCGGLSAQNVPTFSRCCLLLDSARAKLNLDIKQAQMQKHNGKTYAMIISKKRDDNQTRTKSSGGQFDCQS